MNLSNMSDSKSNKDKKRFDLNEVEKKHVFQVPERYFDELPAIVQSRVTKKVPFYQSKTFRIGVRYAFPVACVLVIGIYLGFFSGQDQQLQSFEALMADVSYEDLVAYLENSDISTEEIIGSIEDADFLIEFDQDEFDPLRDFDLEGEGIDELIEELDVNGEYF